MMRIRILCACVCAALLSAAPAVVLAAGGGRYEPTTTVDQTLRQIRRLPVDDIWWSRNGEDMHWNNLNLQKFQPTVSVNRAGPVRELPVRPLDAIPEFVVDTPQGPQAFRRFLDSKASTTMGVVILRRGEVVFEHYPRQQPHDRPIVWSVTKVFVSTVLGILEDRGELDTGKPIDHYLPRLKGSAYEGVSVRNILDMASGVDCGDEYVDRRSCYYRYSASIGEGFRDPGSADNPYDYVASIPASARWAPQGTGFNYSGVDTFVLGWLVESLTGMPFQDAVSREVWTRIGAEADALIWAGRYGIPLTSGGLMARLRDMARFGLLFTPSRPGTAGPPVVSARHVELILRGGNPALLERARGGSGRAGDVAHNVYQWDRVYTNGDILKGGWAGQGLLINPHEDLVAVWSGYYDEAGGEVDVLPMIRAVLSGVFPRPAPASRETPAPRPAS